MSVKLSDLLPAPSGVTKEWASNDPWFKQHEDTMGGTGVSGKRMSALDDKLAALEKSRGTGRAVTAVGMREPPPYGSRKGFQPLVADDFGDGGSFPEIHYAQFPLEMGRNAGKGGGSSGKTLAIQVDGEGKLKYDAIAKQGHGKDKVVYSRLEHMKAKAIDETDETFQRPTEDAVAENTEKTRQALERITGAKMAAALPVRHAEKTAPAEYIRYTPSQQFVGHNSGAQQRIIRMVEVQQDPMEPPKFNINQKIPRPPPSPPAPVMHSPTRKTTVKEQQEWKIPPCISNWKNPKGYTIPLDKRLAADGRGLQQVHINENFAKLAEALYISDRKAREAVETRAKLERRLAQKKKEESEEKMRSIAKAAREERAGIRRPGQAGEEREVEAEARERDDLRRDRRDDRRRERNIARAAPDKQLKLRKDKDRDVSEKIALGLPDAKSRNDDTQFDQRLFNQSKGLDSGGGLDDETFAVYDKPWRNTEGVQQHLYRPGKNLDGDVYGEDLDKIIKTNRFVADKGFAGAEGGAGSSAREGPVQFEKEEEEDPFGLGALLKTAKETGKRKGDKDKDDDRRESKRSRHK